MNLISSPLLVDLTALPSSFDADLLLYWWGVWVVAGKIARSKECFILYLVKHNRQFSIPFASWKLAVSFPLFKSLIIFPLVDFRHIIYNIDLHFSIEKLEMAIQNITLNLINNLWYSDVSKILPPDKLVPLFW